MLSSPLDQLKSVYEFTSCFITSGTTEIGRMVDQHALTLKRAELYCRSHGDDKVSVLLVYKPIKFVC